MKMKVLPSVGGDLGDGKAECKATTQAAELDPGPEEEHQCEWGKSERGLKTD